MLTLACRGADARFVSVEHKVISFGRKQIGSFDQLDRPCRFASLGYLTGICVSLPQMSCRGGFRRRGLGWGLWGGLASPGVSLDEEKMMHPFFLGSLTIKITFHLPLMGLHTQYVYFFEWLTFRQNVFVICRQLIKYSCLAHYLVI